MGNKCLLVDFVKGFNLDPVPPAKYAFKLHLPSLTSLYLH